MPLVDRDWKEKLLPSFQAYRQGFGNCIIPMAFTVPSYPPWPQKAWTMPLGKVVDEMRRGKCYVEHAARDKAVLDAIGFAWNRNDAVWDEIIVPALQVYVDIYTNGKISRNFVVPSEDPWPHKARVKKRADAL
ncbi:hypothetical protein PHYSODRAFT_489153 [Phytophthora sojae]|uniref:Helicase-associated domain-containing protein n=1 Tax=Phytophthora sojae (strain P6497) TaxID=1094619 RepID=G4Z7X6_PHYSP|nr:hypothetical protein PHYSODRAFT_489153 [Phytophthora sojae]EGZ22511.1 hypothetical protein PHYSODRAFT_489153 [Phytophthora sojae]|eukprot:XP_009525228.1 hypothetical protein PHYSODRAFT_489153 [Phytophthora sojae]